MFRCIVLQALVFLIVTSLSLTVTVLHMNVYVGHCIATVDDDRQCLGVDKFHRLVHVYMSLLSFL